MGLITCPECQNTISDKAEVCPKCGYPIAKHTVVKETTSQMSAKNMIRCEHCGNMVNAHTSVCPKCGADLDSHEAVVSTESVGFTDPSEIRKKRLIICAVIICALLVLFGFFRLMSYRSIIKGAKALNTEIEAIENISSDDGDKLRELQYHYDYLPDSAKKYVTSYDYLQKLESLCESLEVQSAFASLSSEEEIRNMDVDDIENFLSKVQSAQQDYYSLDSHQREYVNEQIGDLINNIDNLVKLAEDTKAVLLQPTATPIQDSEPVQDSTPVQDSVDNIISSYNSNYKTTDTLSLAKYEKLKQGMTYEEVVDILGSEGNLVSSSDVNNISIRGYGWYSEYGIPMVCVVFYNGQASQMYQIGLQ